MPSGGLRATVEFYSRKQPRVCRSTFSSELASVDDGISNALLTQVMTCEIVHGPLTAEQIQRCTDTGRLPVDLH
eukprot:9012084-Pyramimonas_sp.AAC.1